MWTVVDLDGESTKNRALPDPWKAAGDHDDARLAWIIRQSHGPDSLACGQPWNHDVLVTSDPSPGPDGGTLPPCRKADQMVSGDEMIDILHDMFGKTRPRT